MLNCKSESGNVIRKNIFKTKQISIRAVRAGSRGSWDFVQFNKINSIYFALKKQSIHIAKQLSLLQIFSNIN